jgi:hypothetical protein
MLPTLALAAVLGAAMAVAVGIAWRSLGAGRSIVDATTPGRAFLVVFVVTTALGSLVLPFVGAGSLGGAALVALGLGAFGVGAAYAASRHGVAPPPGPPADVGAIYWPAVLILAGIGLVAYASIAAQSGIPFLTADAQATRANFAGIRFDLFRWLTPPAVLAAVGFALACGGRRPWAVAVAAAAALIGLMFLTASRALPFELAFAILLLALWAGRRLSGRIWLGLGAAALVFFVGVQLLRVSSEGGFRDLPDAARFVINRTLDRVGLIQPRAIDVVATRIPDQHAFYLGSTYTRWLDAVRGEAPDPALGYWIYEQLYPDHPGGFATPGILGELWANGGVPLVALGMALFGWVVHGLGRLLARIDHGVADRVFAALVVVAVARTYATSLNGFLLTLAVVFAWRIAVTIPALPDWLPRSLVRDGPSAGRR